MRKHHTPKLARPKDISVNFSTVRDSHSEVMELYIGFHAFIIKYISTYLPTTKSENSMADLELGSS